MFDNVGTGPVRKKNVRRSAAERAVIVAESYEPGATVAGVARRHGIVASQLSGWRSAARAKASDNNGGVQFAEVVVSSGDFGSKNPDDGQAGRNQKRTTQDVSPVDAVKKKWGPGHKR